MSRRRKGIRLTEKSYVSRGRVPVEGDAEFAAAIRSASPAISDGLITESNSTVVPGHTHRILIVTPSFVTLRTVFVHALAEAF
jgi:hypothetical protein